MPFSDSQFDRAFAEWQEFGPRRAIPVEQRWAEIFPAATASDFAQARLRCEEIEAYAYEVVQTTHRDVATPDKIRAVQLLSSQYPALTSERLSRTLSQAVYFSIH